MSRRTFGRMLVLVGTVVLTWGALSLGTPVGDPQLQPGDRAERTFEARRAADVVDTEATDLAREQAAERVLDVPTIDVEREAAIFDRVADILATAEEVSQPGESPSIAIPAPVTSTTAEPAEGDTGVTEPEPVDLTGVVFVDVDSDGALDLQPDDAFRADIPLAGVRVVAVHPSGVQFEGTSGVNGEFDIEVTPDEYTIYVDTVGDESTFPAGFGSPDRLTQQVACSAEGCNESNPVALVPLLPSVEERIARLEAEAPQLSADTVATLVRLAEEDLYREVAGTQLAIDDLSREIVERLTQLFNTGISEDEVDSVSAQALSDRRTVTIDGRADPDAQAAVRDITAEVIDNNLVVDQDQTEALRQQARDQVEEVTVSYRAGEVIVAEGQFLTALDIAAIEETGAFNERTQRRVGLFGVLAVLVATLAYYLARFRVGFWQRPRMVALLGMLIILAAAAVRGTVAVAEASDTLYVIPAVALGYLASVLFDNRMGTLMALAVAVLTAVGTFDPGVTVYAGLATLAPIGFVSAVSTRRAFRNSVLIASASAGVIAAATTWFFESNPGAPAWPQIWPNAAWAAVVSLGAALLALAAMPFFEAMFDVTTTLRLLELTDRNHEALQLIQDRAFGTFNHSLMVGTLADAGAKAIGANNLLARAAAYFHDIGKTENPTFFIENQFGIPNPHDELSPEQSAEVIRRHVLDGIELARKHRIPSDVAEGIVAHHGDGIMRYFYEQARQKYGAENVDPDLYRHAGHKPRRREMAIVMMADAVEGACRAVFGEEEPTRDSIEKVVDRVIDEKVADGQLSESDLTFGELTKVRRAFTDSLIGHYHQRIPYPNFPGE